jgi:hydrogenase maturation protease
MILIIGYGNQLRGDGGVARHIVRQLEVQVYREGVDIMGYHQLAPELSEAISKVDEVIFVDAVQGGGPGAVTERQIEAGASTGSLTDNVTPESLLTAAFDLFGTKPKGLVISISGAKFDDGETLSPAVEAAIPAVLRRIHQLIDNHFLHELGEQRT